MGVYFLSALVLSNLSAGVIKLIFWNFVKNFPTQIVAYLKFVQKKKKKLALWLVCLWFILKQFIYKYLAKSKYVILWKTLFYPSSGKQKQSRFDVKTFCVSMVKCQSLPGSAPPAGSMSAWILRTSNPLFSPS